MAVSWDARRQVAGDKPSVSVAHHASAVDDLAIGRLFRELRIRLGWRAVDVAARARISQAAYSRIEHGAFETLPVGKLRRVAAVLDVRIQLEPRWRGAGADRVLSTRHAAMTDAVTRILQAAGWEVRAEVSFNEYGERGIVDLVAWHVASRTLLLVEIKTELVDANRLLATSDIRRRLARTIGSQFGWQHAALGQWIVLAESRTNHRRLAEVAAMVRASFPHDGRALRRWLANPRGGIAVLSFLLDSHGANARRKAAPTARVARARPARTAPPKAA